MALIIETGGGIQNANTYVDLGTAKQLLGERGLEYAVNDAQAEGLLVQASDYIETMGNLFIGEKTTESNALVWPRREIEGVEENEIPARLILFQVLISYAAQTVNLFPVVSPRNVKKEKVGEIEQEYFSPAESTTIPRLSEYEKLISHFLKPGAFSLNVIRV